MLHVFASLIIGPCTLGLVLFFWRHPTYYLFVLTRFLTLWEGVARLAGFSFSWRVWGRGEGEEGGGD